MAGYLVVNSETPDAYFFELEEGRTLEIGRKPAVQPGQLKLILPIPEVSSQHAEIRPSSNGWTLMDTGSTNGTQLNGSWLTSGQEHLLKNGDHIRIAQVNIIVNLPDTALQRSDESHNEDEHERTQLHIKLATATILVADIRGFTTLMEAYSAQPDLVMQAAQRVFSTFNEEIKRQHGQVEKIAGDAVMAYWQGDDMPDSPQNVCAYQACYSALKLKEIVLKLAANKDVWPFPDFPLRMDIALATGPVATGALGGGKSSLSVLGDTANLAFRLEKLIGEELAGDIVLDGITYELVKGRFNIDSLGAFTVKGRQRTVNVYRLIDFLPTQKV